MPLARKKNKKDSHNYCRKKQLESPIKATFQTVLFSWGHLFVVGPHLQEKLVKGRDKKETSGSVKLIKEDRATGQPFPALHDKYEGGNSTRTSHTCVTCRFSTEPTPMKFGASVLVSCHWMQLISFNQSDSLIARHLFSKCISISSSTVF